jgi:short-subunit dehydrogenase
MGNNHIKKGETKGYAIITGASSGIGYEMADILAQKGYPLIIVARREDRLLELKNQLVSKYQAVVEVLALDLSTHNAAIALHEYTQKGNFDVEFLINNAGFGMQNPFLEQAADRMIEMVNLNVITLTHLTQLYAADFIKRGSGKIMQVASSASFVPTPFLSSYSATKAYVHHYSQALGFELRNTCISYTTLYPGFTATEFGAVADAKVPAMIQATQTTARKVAEAGIAGMLNGKKSVIPGIFNKISVYSASILPTSLMVYITGKLMGSGMGIKN